jgi:hypothetical protein
MTHAASSRGEAHLDELKLDALRRAVACAHALLDEIERWITAERANAADRAALTNQVAEELLRLARLIAAMCGPELGEAPGQS